MSVMECRVILLYGLADSGQTTSVNPIDGELEYPFLHLIQNELSYLRIVGISSIVVQRW